MRQLRISQGSSRSSLRLRPWQTWSAASRGVGVVEPARRYSVPNGTPLNGGMRHNRQRLVLFRSTWTPIHRKQCPTNEAERGLTKPSHEGYPIASDIFTTLQKTVVPDPIPADSETVFPYELSKYKQNGYGSWQYGPGLDPVKRLDLMPTTYRGASATSYFLERPLRLDSPHATLHRLPDT